jgi:hypothetical protein
MLNHNRQKTKTKTKQKRTKELNNIETNKNNKALSQPTG